MLVQVDSSSSTVGKITVLKDSVLVGIRPKLNFLTGNNMTLTVTEDTTLNAIDVRVDATGGGGGGGTATDLATVGAAVNVSASAAPTAGQVLTAASATAATWQAIGAASGVRSATTSVITTGSAAPSAGQVLIATGGAAATWQSPANLANVVAYKLKSVSTEIDISPASAPNAGDVLTATGSTTATWQTPASGGDSITVNGSAVVNADFDDATPAAPANSLNVVWAKDTSSPANISASILMTNITKVGTITVGTWNGTTIAIANGGTGQASKTAAYDGLSPNTTKGDIEVFNGTNNVRLAVGSNTQVLTADSAQAEGVKWAAPAASGGERTFTKSIDFPSASENITIGFFHAAQTIIRVASVIQTAGGSVDWNLYKGTDRSAAGTKVFTAEQTTTSTTTGAIVTSFDSASIGADNWLWMKTSALGATPPSELAIAITITEP